MLLLPEGWNNAWCLHNRHRHLSHIAFNNKRFHLPSRIDLHTSPLYGVTFHQCQWSCHESSTCQLEFKCFNFLPSVGADKAEHSDGWRDSERIIYLSGLTGDSRLRNSGSLFGRILCEKHRNDWTGASRTLNKRRQKCPKLRLMGKKTQRIVSAIIATSVNC